MEKILLSEVHVNSTALKKHYAIFIIAWLVLFVFCSVLSGVAANVDAAETATDTDKTTPVQSSTSASPEATTPPKTDSSAAPETPATTDPSTEQDPPATTDPQPTVPPSVSPLPIDPANAQHIIYLDAGHGWRDVGCSILNRTDVYEKDVTLAITKLIQQDLLDMGYTVHMARENDETCAEELVDGIYRSTRRAQYANKLGADYYVSIHVDNFTDTSASGTRVYYIDRFEESDEFSDQIASSIANEMNIDKPVQKDDRRYNVLVVSAMPSVLIEVGFGSNPTDAANMTNADWQKAFARAVALGIDAQVKAGSEG